MNKLKEILQGITFLLIGIPIMIMASIMDQRAFKKEREQRQKAREQSKWLCSRGYQYTLKLLKK